MLLKVPFLANLRPHKVSSNLNQSYAVGCESIGSSEARFVCARALKVMKQLPDGGPGGSSKFAIWRCKNDGNGFKMGQKLQIIAIHAQSTLLCHVEKFWG
jgi:hypothetical protein